jgi:IS30 family transposase
LLCQERAQSRRNAFQIDPITRDQVAEHLKLQWSPEQIAAFLPVSHETIYRHVYADKAQGGSLWKFIRCQKKRRKRYAGGQDRRGQIIGRRLITQPPASVETRKEFADHAAVDKALDSTAYFADPFASWQRGSYENFNGLLRQYIPKK